MVLSMQTTIFARQQRSCRNLVIVFSKNQNPGVFESLSMLNMDPVPSITPRPHKLIKFDHCNKYFKKFLSNFITILEEFPLFFLLICLLFRLHSNLLI